MLAGLGVLFSAPAHAASTSCAERVVSDWYGDQRLDEIYPLRCYEEAIRSLPVDVLDYSNAPDDIRRALQYARQGKVDRGVTGGTEAKDNQPGAGTPSTSGGSSSDPDGTDRGGEATERVNTSGPSTIPIPLIVLGCFALVLLGAGAIGYLARRR